MTIVSPRAADYGSADDPMLSRISHSPVASAGSAAAQLRRSVRSLRLLGLVKLWLIAVLLVAPVLTGCGTQVVFVSAYDQATDDGVTALQKEVDSLLDKCAQAFAQTPPAPAPDYASQQATYADIHLQLNVLITRNQARSKNDLTTQQLQALAKEIDTLEDQHKKAQISAYTLPNQRTLIDTTFGAILKLEITKKETAPVKSPQ